MKLVSQCIGVHWQICVFHKWYWKWQWMVTRGVQGLIKWQCLLANTKNPHVMGVANHGIVSPFTRFVYLSFYEICLLKLLAMASALTMHLPKPSIHLLLNFSTSMYNYIMASQYYQSHVCGS